MANPSTKTRSSWNNHKTSYMSVPGEVPAADDPLFGFAPVEHEKPRRNTITPDKQRAFIGHLAATGIVTQAASHIGASTSALYKLRHLPGAEEFSAAWDAAIDRGMERLQDCALERAIAGEERLVVSSGKVMGTEIRHNDNLVMFFLKNRLSGRYSSHVRPGHPLYERIRAEVVDEINAAARAERPKILATLAAKFELMKEREEAARKLLAGDKRD